MKAKRILDELLAKGEFLPDALILCFMEKHKVNPVAELVKADRRRRFIRWLTFPLLVTFIISGSAAAEARFRTDVISGPASLVEAAFWTVLGCFLFRLALPYVFTISYNDHEEERFFGDLAKVRRRLCPFFPDERWHDKVKLRALALKILYGDAEAIKNSREDFGELDERTQVQERVMKEDCALFLFYNLLPQFENAKKAHREAFEWANKQPRAVETGECPQNDAV